MEKKVVNQEMFDDACNQVRERLLDTVLKAADDDSVVGEKDKEQFVLFLQQDINIYFPIFTGMLRDMLFDLDKDYQPLVSITLAEVDGKWKMNLNISSNIEEKTNTCKEEIYQNLHPTIARFSEFVIKLDAAFPGESKLSN